MAVTGPDEGAATAGQAPAAGGDAAQAGKPELAGAPWPTPRATQVPSVGRVTHFILRNCRTEGEHRPATITSVHGPYVNLHVLLEGRIDQGATGNPEATSMCVTSVMQDPTGKTPGSWHWPEYV